MDTFPIVPFGLLLTLTVAVWWAHRSAVRLLDREIQGHSEQWRRDGKPFIWFYQAPRSAFSSTAERYLSAQLATCRALLAWLLFTPAWIAGDPLAKKLHRGYRLASFVAVLSVLPWCLLFIGIFIMRALDT